MGIKVIALWLSFNIVNLKLVWLSILFYYNNIIIIYFIDLCRWMVLYLILACQLFFLKL